MVFQVAGKVFQKGFATTGETPPLCSNDARLFRDELVAILKRSNSYRAVVPVSLVAGRQDDESRPDELPPAKGNLRSLLELLAGKQLDPSRSKDIPLGLQPVRPEDLVLIFFSGHGDTDASGSFRLYPYDLGTDDEIPASRLISSDELATWLRDVDAGEMVMILDACRSGAASEPGFKPGPMGDRGLGQLAYDKGMRILASSQADADTISVANLRHGLLTYALVHEGLQKGEALEKKGSFSLIGWLRYGEQRVPELYLEKVEPSQKMESEAQRPALFDFASSRSIYGMGKR